MNLHDQLEATMRHLVAANALMNALSTALADLTSATDSLGEYASVLMTSEVDALVQRHANQTIHEAWKATHTAQEAVESRIAALEAEWTRLREQYEWEVAR